MILFVNACTRRESRTMRLAEYVLGQMQGEVERVDLYRMHFPLTDEEFLIKRDRLTAEGRFDDPMFDLAEQFAAADKIVIAAPYWDLSFPAVLKQYLEQVTAHGVTFVYDSQGIPEGRCRAAELIYVTTVGAIQLPMDYGYGYVKALAQIYYGIPEVRLVQAEGLDLAGADPEQILWDIMKES